MRLNATTRLRRLGQALLAAAVLGTGIVAVEAATTTPAAAASTAGGYITRSEILQRAQYWVDQNVIYGWNSSTGVRETASGPDAANPKYGTDCSGLVGMAWHLTDSPNTDGFMSASSRWFDVPGGANGMLPGDAMVRNGHMELFVAWKSPSNHSLGAWTYSLNGPFHGDWAKGPIPNSHGQVGDAYPASEFTRFIRYAKVLEDSTSPQLLVTPSGTLPYCNNLSFISTSANTGLPVMYYATYSSTAGALPTNCDMYGLHENGTTREREAIAQLQREINKCYISTGLINVATLSADGQYGNNTRAAVQAVQAYHGGLTADGWAGPNTRKTMYHMSSSNPQGACVRVPSGQTIYLPSSSYYTVH